MHRNNDSKPLVVALVGLFAFAFVGCGGIESSTSVPTMGTLTGGKADRTNNIDTVNEITLSELSQPITIPEDSSAAIDPHQMNSVDANYFQSDIMPQIIDLKFYSHSDHGWHKIRWQQTNNYCFARRTAIDSFLWFGYPLKADWNDPNPSDPVSKGTYLLKGFTQELFKKTSWIETARINVTGKLKADNIEPWNNHEAVVINTNLGIRIVDPSFSSNILTLEDWFQFFAPNESNRQCVQTNQEGLAAINWQLVRTQQFHEDWDESVPYCGYSFAQRIDAADVVTHTGFFDGTVEQKFLSAKFYTYFEEDLLKDY